MTPELFVAGALAVALALYLADCRLWPFAACPRCKGSGKRRSPSGKAWGPCRWCKGAGKRLRVGRRLLDSASDRGDT